MTTLEQATQEIIEAGKTLYQMGLVPATSGNFSMRLDDGNIAITVSGKHKGKLTAQDIMQVNAEGHPLDNKKPSAETLLHTQLYEEFERTGAILHPHAMNAILLAEHHSDFIELANYELLKAFDGIATHDTSVIVPVFENDQNIERLARRVQGYLDYNEKIYAYVIKGHGLYAWGRTMDEAMRYIEALDYLFACELRAKH